MSSARRGYGPGGGHDRRRLQSHHDACARREPEVPTPHNRHRPKQYGDQEGGGQCSEQIGGDAWEIGPRADPNGATMQIDRLRRPAIRSFVLGPPCQCI